MKLFKKTAIIKITGGLGNQMFQYSYGEYLKSNGLNVYHDYFLWLTLNKKKLRIKELNIQLRSASKLLIIIFGIFERMRYSTFVLFEKKAYQKQEIGRGNLLYYVGYWQNVNYLLKNKDILKRHFAYNINNKKVNEFTNTINNNSVAIHVRRGDYVNNKVHETIGVNYFKKAVKEILSLVDNPQFFILSDDISWCKKNLLVPKCIYIDFTSSEIEDFEIIKRCNHKIISNSSFSWWAAFLGETERSITICPKKWTNVVETNSLQLANWIKI